MNAIQKRRWKLLKSATKLMIKYLFLFIVGALIYYSIEIAWDGTSHWTMGVLGGICFLLIGLINEYLSWETPLWLQGIIGSAIITCFEFMAGCILNIWLGLGVWDYSQLPFNIMGQICLAFSIAWIGLSVLAIILDDWLRYWLFDEEKPHYRLF